MRAELVPHHRDQVVESRRLVGPIAGWMLGAGLLAHGALPYLAALLGVFPGIWLTASATWAAGWTTIALALIAFVSSTRRSVVIPRDLSAGRDPVLSALAGSLAMWAVVVNVGLFFTPLWAMPASYALTLALLNVVESSLLAVVVASLFRTRRGAFVAAGALQGLGLLATAVAWMVLV